MYNLDFGNFNVFGKPIYIAKRKGTKEDSRGNLIPYYDTPKKYYFNVQPVNSDAELTAFGELAFQRMKCICNRKEYEGVFTDGDVAYLDGATPKGEKINGEKANYTVKGNPLNQNLVTVIYFERIIEKQKIAKEG
jgi:hypothetical protein